MTYDSDGCPQNPFSGPKAILALDWATSTGAAFGPDSSENWLLATDAQLRAAKKTRLDRRHDIRAQVLWTRLEQLARNWKIDYVVFEDVKFGKSLAQVQLWGTWRGVVWGWATYRQLPLECVSTQDLKRWATGSGAADKLAMTVSLIRKFPEFYTMQEKPGEILAVRRRDGTLLSDDEVDALHLHDWARHHLRT